ncbi:GNAT family N-acetyltransferase [Gynuella sp.]|uniref:GNAT family N-acetyltransferase n=1 Tax=Gynuella sp. TaxID=2969146 RepID=UPI003D0F9DD1
MFRVESCPPNHPELRILMDELSQTLQRLTGDDGRGSFVAEDLAQQGYLLKTQEQAVGCCVVRPHAPGIAELKRMYSRISGGGRALLVSVEQAALQDGYQKLILATRQVNHKAISFYHKMGYRHCEPYGKYRSSNVSVCMEKIL